MLELRGYQNDTLNALREGFAKGYKSQILYSPTGGGKCLRKGTPVIMADGTTKKVEDVAVGDRLLGPDGSPRNVLSLGRGRDTMYEVRPVKGDPYYVNSGHILSLRKTPGTDGMYLSDGSYVAKDADVVNVNVEVFANSNNTVRHSLKGWRSEAVEFNREETKLPIDPYILGVWLGDGSSSGPTIHKPFGKMVRAWQDFGRSLGLDTYEYKSSPTACSAWRLAWPDEDRSKPNPARILLQSLGLIGNKHIPDMYKYASVKDRALLIAGLLDSDGHLHKSGFDWISKFPVMASDMVFLCRSVGLSAYAATCKKGIAKTGFEGTYVRVSISGDCDRIPCLDKRSPPRKQIKRHLVTGLTVTKVGEEDYYGFAIDGDHLFLLGDFTVTHNTEMAIALMNATKQKGNRAAMILDRIILCDQTSRRLDKYKIDHGVLQSGHWRYRPSENIQVCSAQTLERRGSMPNLNLLIVDECHASRKQTIEFIKNNPSVKVIGLTATPFTKGIGQTYENVVSTVTTKQLVDQGVLVPLRVFLAKEIDMEGAKKIAGEWSEAEASARGMKITGDIVAEWIKKTHEIFGKPVKTVVFCSGVAHGNDLAAKFAEQGYNFVSISYQDDDAFKRDAIEDFSKPDTKIHGLIATDILTKGFDVPDVLIGVSARPFSKSLSSHIQQMGRVMRGAPGKSFAVWLDHAGNYLRFRQDWEEIYEDGVKSLDDGKEKAKKEPTEKEKKESKCPACGHLWPAGSDTCLHCGHVRERRSQVISVPGEMEELGPVSKDDKQHWWSMCYYKIQFSGWSNGRAAHTYREKFGVWPKNLKDVPAMPDAAFEKFVRAKLMRYLKGKK